MCMYIRTINMTISGHRPTLVSVQPRVPNPTNYSEGGRLCVILLLDKGSSLEHFITDSRISQPWIGAGYPSKQAVFASSTRIEGLESGRHFRSPGLCTALIRSIQPRWGLASEQRFPLGNLAPKDSLSRY